MPEEKPVCARCNGKGFLPVEGDDFTVQQCICAYSRALRAHLGVEIATAPLITKSPLFVAGDAGEPPKIDRTKENLFIKGYWRDLLSHFKWALGCKGPLFPFRLLTDEKLKVVWLGQESYAARAKSRRDEVVTYNSLADLVGPDIDLVIIRLGFLGHKNIAMPGILKEAMMIREFACKPTWIVEVPTSLYGPGHFSYSEEVADYIAEKFEVVDLVRKESARSDEVPHGIEISPLAIALDADDGDDVTIGSLQPTPASMRHMPKPRFERPTIDTDTDLPGEGVSARKKQYGKKKPSSGGPV